MIDLVVVVGEEHFEHVDELGALDRVAADADGGRLAEPCIGGLEHCLIGKRSRARNNADRALAEDVAGHDADLAFVGRQHARAVGADQPRLRAVEPGLDLDHVHHRDAFGDADDQPDLGVDRLDDRFGGAGRRHIDHRRAGAGLFLAFGDRREDRQVDRAAVDVAGPGLAALLRVDAADHLGAVIGERLLGVERAGLAGQPLHENLGIPVDENGHEPFWERLIRPAKRGDTRRPPSANASACMTRDGDAGALVMSKRVVPVSERRS